MSLQQRHFGKREITELSRAMFFCGAVKAADKPVWGDNTGFYVEAINKSTGKSFSCDST